MLRACRGGPPFLEREMSLLAASKEENFHLQGNRCCPQELFLLPFLAAGAITRVKSPQDLAGDVLRLIRNGDITLCKSFKQ